MFRKKCGLHFQVCSDYSHEAIAVYSSEALVIFYQATLCYIPEDRSLMSYSGM
jgi:hypothetical protein